MVKEGVGPISASSLGAFFFIWVFPKIGVPQNGWFMMENLIKMDDLGYPYFWKHFLVGELVTPEN